MVNLEYPHNLLRRYKLSLISTDIKLCESEQEIVNFIISFLNDLNDLNDNDVLVFIDRRQFKMFTDIIHTTNMSYINIFKEWCEYLFNKDASFESIHW